MLLMLSIDLSVDSVDQCSTVFYNVAASAINELFMYGKDHYHLYMDGHTSKRQGLPSNLFSSFHLR